MIAYARVQAVKLLWSFAIIWFWCDTNKITFEPYLERAKEDRIFLMRLKFVSMIEFAFFPHDYGTILGLMTDWYYTRKFQRSTTCHSSSFNDCKQSQTSSPKHNNKSSWKSCFILKRIRKQIYLAEWNVSVIHSKMIFHVFRLFK